jgi:phospholipid transport system transporter-binding protein
MISIAGDVLQVSGAMTLKSAAKLLAEGNAALKNPETVFDLEKVDAVDSSAIAVIFGWLREAREQGKSLRIAHPPKELLSLAAVYGVSELLPQ